MGRFLLHATTLDGTSWMPLVGGAIMLGIFVYFGFFWIVEWVRLKWRDWRKKR